MSRNLRFSQGGGATLAIALLLALLALLTAGFVHRGLVFEHRSSVNHYRAAQAFEAAEAGLAWATALLDSPVALDAQCRPQWPDAGLRLAERVRSAPAELACVEGEAGWTCQCPQEGPATWAWGASGLGFVVSLRAQGAAVELHARGCSDVTACDEQATGVSRARVQVTVGRLPGLAVTPQAALTVRGDADLRNAELELAQASSEKAGITLHAGGQVALAAAPRLSTVPGAPTWASLRDGDASLAALSAGQLVAHLFGLDAAAWRDQPAARRIECRRACDEALADALAQGARLLWLEGGLQLQQELHIGTAERPVLLVVNGPLALAAEVSLHGLMHLRSAQITTTTMHVSGAVVAENDLIAHGRLRVQHDIDVLERLRTQTGSHARVPGTWRDF